VSDYKTWEAKLGMLFADAQRALSTDDYARLCEWLRDVSRAELELVRGEPGEE
jgi:hypothetical protein